MNCFTLSWVPVQTQRHERSCQANACTHTSTDTSTHINTHNNMQTIHAKRWQSALRKCQNADYWGRESTRTEKSPMSDCRAGRKEKHCWRDTHTPRQPVWCKKLEQSGSACTHAIFEALWWDGSTEELPEREREVGESAQKWTNKKKLR